MYACARIRTRAVLRISEQYARRYTDPRLSEKVHEVLPLRERLVRPELRPLLELLDGIFQIDPVRRSKPWEALECSMFAQ